MKSTDAGGNTGIVRNSPSTSINKIGSYNGGGNENNSNHQRKIVEQLSGGGNHSSKRKPGIKVSHALKENANYQMVSPPEIIYPGGRAHVDTNDTSGSLRNDSH